MLLLRRGAYAVGVPGEIAEEAADVRIVEAHAGTDVSGIVVWPPERFGPRLWPGVDKRSGARAGRCLGLVEGDTTSRRLLAQPSVGSGHGPDAE